MSGGVWRTGKMMSERKKGRIILAAVAALAAVPGTAPMCALAAQTQTDSPAADAPAVGKEEIAVSFGFENTVQTGRFTAVHVRISPELNRQAESLSIRTADPSGVTILYEYNLREEKNWEESADPTVSAEGNGEESADPTVSAEENGEEPAEPIVSAKGNGKAAGMNSSGMSAQALTGPGAEEQDDSETYTYCVPFGSRMKSMQIILKDASGRILAETQSDLPKTKSDPQSYIGVFSDRSDQLDWMNGVEVDDGAFSTRTILLDKNTAPEDPLEYDELDMIVISDYDTSLLNPEQVDSIYSFAANGGILLFGGGEAYRSGFGPFAERFLTKTPLKEAEKRMVNMGPQYARKSPDDSLVELSCADVTLVGGNTLISGERFPLLSMAACQKGFVEAAAYSLSDISGFAAENPAYTQNFFEEAYGGTMKNIVQADHIAEDTYFDILDLTGTGDMDNLPNATVYALILILYLIAVGPGVYLILRAHRRQRYYLAAVAACSALFTCAVYVAGVRTRFSGPFYTYATILDVTGGGQQENTCLNLRSPNGRSFRTVLSEGYRVIPVSYPYDMGKGVLSPDPNSYHIGVSSDEDGTQIRIRGRESFASSMFCLTRNENSLPDGNTGNDAAEAVPESGEDTASEQTPMKYRIGGQASIMEMKASGTVTNRSTEAIRDAAVLFGGKAVLIGDMEPGETVDLSKCSVLNIPVGDSALAADGIIASLRSSLDPQTDRIRRLEKARLLLFYMRRDTMEYAGKGRFIGFPQNSTPEFLRESLTDKDPDGQRITVSGQTIVTCELDEPDRADGPDGRIYSPALRRLPRVISGEYYADYNQMNGTENGPLTLEYAFDSRLVIEKIDFEKLSPVYTEQSGKSPDFSKVPMFNGNIYFYNYDTGKNDLMETKDSYTAEELAPYLSPANTLMIRYSGGNEGLQYLPVPCAVGKRAEKQE